MQEAIVNTLLRNTSLAGASTGSLKGELSSFSALKVADPLGLSGFSSVLLPWWEDWAGGAWYQGRSCGEPRLMDTMAYMWDFRHS